MNSGLESAIQDVICAMAISIAPVEDALNGAGSETALYAIYRLRDEVDRLQEEMNVFYAGTRDERMMT